MRPNDSLSTLCIKYLKRSAIANATLTQLCSTLVLENEHIATQNKNKADIIYLSVVVENIVGTTENNSNILVWYIAYLHILHNEYQVILFAKSNLRGTVMFW